MQMSAHFLKFERRQRWQSCYIWAGYNFSLYTFSVSDLLISNLSLILIWEFSLLDCIFRMVWRSIRVWLVNELSLCTGIQIVLSICQVHIYELNNNIDRPKIYLNIIFISFNWNQNSIDHLLPNVWCSNSFSFWYFRRRLPPIRTYILLPFILLPWIGVVACKNFRGLIAVTNKLKFISDQKKTKMAKC